MLDRKAAVMGLRLLCHHLPCSVSSPLTVGALQSGQEWRVGLTILVTRQMLDRATWI